ncbi:CHAT domain-containing protein [Favolaschia claudopus]|uniref:CHAT domain-containing protein n=1 Tax=Favolaschia claudopus TaxID=2862362 RepID=A0AAW0AW93_9AGAR
MQLIQQTSPGHPDLPGYHMKLMEALEEKYSNPSDTANLEPDLEEALDYMLMPDNDSNEVLHLQSLADAQANQYQKRGDLKYLEAALQNARAAVDLLPEEHPNKAQHLQDLAVLYTDRYRRLGDLEDLEAALQNDQMAVDLTSKDHFDRSQRLHNLAVSHSDRYRRLGDLEDLEAALRYIQEAVDLAPTDHPERAQYLQRLAISYSDRYQRLGDLKDLETALQYSKEIVDLMPQDHPDRAQQLHNCAVSYADWYERLGDLKDLEIALQTEQETINLIPEGHPMRAQHLQNLAVSYTNHYRRLGDIGNLEAALKYKQAAMDLTPSDHPDKAQHLQSLAGSYTDRYQRLGELKDLETALQYNQAAVDLIPKDHPDRNQHLQNLTPEDHPDRAQCLQRLAVSYGDRYQRLNDLKDLEAALQMAQAALDLTSSDHPSRAQHLQGLALSHAVRYQRLGDLEDLEAALQKIQAAVDLTPDDHPNKVQRLQNLGVSYIYRYEKLGDLKDLEAALQKIQKVVDLTPTDHPQRAEYLQNLALSYTHRYERFKEPDDLKIIYTHFKTSFDLMTSSPERSWENALSWATFAAKYQPEHCITAFILWIGHSIPVRCEALERLNISQTTSSVTRKCINLSELTYAVEIIEQGLGTIYQQMLQLKTAAQSFRQLSGELYTSGSDPSMNLVNRRNDLIKDIRKQPGFEFFLLPKPYGTLCQASKRGPVVILNSHNDGCDGIIIPNPTSQPVHVLFPNVTLDLLGSHRTTLTQLYGHRVRGKSGSTRLYGQPEGRLPITEQCATLLTWLWTCIVSPVYEVLKLHAISNGRLWWLPTGGFTGLPLHACPPVNHSDQFVHSYTATLGSLLEAYVKKQSSISNQLAVVGVTQTNSAGANYLNGVEQEVENILSVAKQINIKCLQGNKATVDGVKMQLQTCSWLHLACHGKQDLIEPTKSHLLLYGGELELGTILRMPLSHAEVVFLAACETAMGDSKLVNESFHLGGGFIAAGFLGAIGTLWSVDDRDAPVVAKHFYSHLFGRGHQPQASDAAEALHFAIKELKKTVPSERWVPFIHIGV